MNTLRWKQAGRFGGLVRYKKDGKNMKRLGVYFKVYVQTDISEQAEAIFCIPFMFKFFMKCITSSDELYTLLYCNEGWEDPKDFVYKQ